MNFPMTIRVQLVVFGIQVFRHKVMDVTFAGDLPSKHTSRMTTS
jgi:hypothetical protein